MGAAEPPGLYHRTPSDAAMPVNQRLTSASALAAPPSMQRQPARMSQHFCLLRLVAVIAECLRSRASGSTLASAHRPAPTPLTARGPDGASPSSAHNLVNPVTFRRLPPRLQAIGKVRSFGYRATVAANKSLADRRSFRILPSWKSGVSSERMREAPRA